MTRKMIPRSMELEELYRMEILLKQALTRALCKDRSVLGDRVQKQESIFELSFQNKDFYNHTRKLNGFN